MNEEGGGMVLGNCGGCGGSLWQSKRRGEPMFCDPCRAKAQLLRAQPNTEKRTKRQDG